MEPGPVVSLPKLVLVAWVKNEGKPLKKSCGAEKGVKVKTDRAN